MKGGWEREREKREREREREREIGSFGCARGKRWLLKKSS